MWSWLVLDVHVSGLFWARAQISVILDMELHCTVWSQLTSSLMHLFSHFQHSRAHRDSVHEPVCGVRADWAGAFTIVQWLSTLWREFLAFLKLSWSKAEHLQPETQTWLVSVWMVHLHMFWLAENTSGNSGQLWEPKGLGVIVWDPNGFFHTDACCRCRLIHNYPSGFQSRLRFG